MHLRTSFAVQAFEHAAGRLVPSARTPASSEVDAPKRAGAMAARLPGAAALKLVPEGPSGTTTILGAFGDVSDGLAVERRLRPKDHGRARSVTRCAGPAVPASRCCGNGTVSRPDR